MGNFVPSTACLCQSGDCFYATFEKYRQRANKNMCVPFGSYCMLEEEWGGAR